MDRKQRLLAHVDLTTQTGLEVGALCNPLVDRSEGRVHYVDYLTTEQLQERYRHDPKVDLARIVPVDYVWADNTLREAVGLERQFDYLIASHVIEHVPDIIGWLRQIAEVLAAGGILSLAVPDKRYTFDYLRQTTCSADLVDAHLRGVRKPTIKQVYDFLSNAAKIDRKKALAGAGKDALLRRRHPDPRYAYNICRDRVAAGEYVEAHCGVFTPDSFVALLRELSALELLDYRVAAFYPTAAREIEFIVALERMEDGLPVQEKRRLQLKSLPSPEAGDAKPSADSREVDKKDATIRALSLELARMTDSRSWRLTEPLRKLRGWIASRPL